MPKEEKVGRRGGQTVQLVLGDSLIRLKDFPDCSVEAVISDPPYG